MIVEGVALLAIVVYALGIRMHRARRERPVGTWQCVCFSAGVLLIALALAPPLDALVDASFTAHMAQHIVLTLLAPPLILLGAPLRLALTASPPRVARRIARALRSRIIRRLSMPVVALLGFVTVMWVTHFSGLYEAALENETVHAGEHALFFGAGLLFWYPLVGIGPMLHPLPHLGRLIYLFLAMPQGAFLGLAIYQARHVLYPHYLVTRNAFGISALADQQSGGELMWIAGSLIMFVALLLVTADWARDDARLAARTDARLATEGLS